MSSEEKQKKQAKIVELLPGEILFKRGDHGRAAYLVRSGELEVVIDSHRLAKISSGDLIGEMALITGEERGATVRAITEATLAEIGQETLQKNGTSRPSFASVAQGFNAAIK